jgi:uncharacterized RDD family membrane protein YckC
VSQQLPGTDPTGDPEGVPTPQPGMPSPTPPTSPSDIETTRVSWATAAPPPTPSVDDGTGGPHGVDTGPAVLWATPAPRIQAEVPGAPGLSFADTASRFVAFIIDSVLVAIVGSIIAGLLGLGTTRTFQSGTVTGANLSVEGAAFAVPAAIVGLAYFVFFWTGGRRATLGQQLFKLQVGNAFDGQPLTLTQAVKRWLGYGSFLGIFAVVPAIYGLASLVQFVWVFVLLVTTVRSPTKQGVHDRFANSAVVRPSNQSTSGLATACLIIAVVLILLFVFSIGALIFLGSQVSDILSRVGESV